MAEAPDVICVQETKLQEVWSEWSSALPGYDSYWTFSSSKKGYAGTAAFVRKSIRGPPATALGPGLIVKSGCTPPAAPKVRKSIASFFKPTALTSPSSEEITCAVSISTSSTDSTIENEVSSGPHVISASFGIGHETHDCEGRSITLVFEQFFIVALYVPNSGQKLERLDYRIKEWNPALQTYVARLEAELGRPAVVLGDLNVAHRDVDVYNYFAPHLKKQSGCTAEERAAHSEWLAKGYVDAFRHIHGDVTGHYSYWSTMHANRSANKGLRLDGFICSRALARAPPLDGTASSFRIADSYTIPEITRSSDHAPVALILAHET
jgi:exodeoxyribonuclease III